MSGLTRPTNNAGIFTRSVTNWCTWAARRDLVTSWGWAPASAALHMLASVTRCALEPGAGNALVEGDDGTLTEPEHACGAILFPLMRHVGSVVCPGCSCLFGAWTGDTIP
jgi:hypothetical protein